MERSSYFIKDKALFGSYPTQESVEELEKEGVRYFIDLTFMDEKKISPYKTKYNYLSYPIKDRLYPENTNEFAKFIIKIKKIILNLEGYDKIYIHCKGGHGRSGVLVAILLCQIFDFTPENALEHTTRSHNTRIIMRDKWRKIGSPQTFQQKNFVYHFCKPIYFFKATYSGYTAGFSIFSHHEVNIPNFKIFDTSFVAYDYFKNNKEYLVKLLQDHNKKTQHSIDENSNKSNFDLLYIILKHKFDQHQNLKEALLNTNLRPIIYHNKSDIFFGDGYDENGTNLLGKALIKVRNFYFQI
tara:strand:- start:2323 stop:3216 length:894 start_codon:yes stop_codon:yes gene_type:complete